VIVKIIITYVQNSIRQSLSRSGFKHKIIRAEASRRLQGHTPRPRDVVLRSDPSKKDPSTESNHWESGPSIGNLCRHPRREEGITYKQLDNKAKTEQISSTRLT
jgi:hypothetical protein